MNTPPACCDCRHADWRPEQWSCHRPVYSLMDGHDELQILCRTERQLDGVSRSAANRISEIPEYVACGVEAAFFEADPQ